MASGSLMVQGSIQSFTINYFDELAAMPHHDLQLLGGIAFDAGDVWSVARLDRELIDRELADDEAPNYLLPAVWVDNAEELTLWDFYRSLDPVSTEPRMVPLELDDITRKDQFTFESAKWDRLAPEGTFEIKTTFSSASGLVYEFVATAHSHLAIEKLRRPGVPIFLGSSPYLIDHESRLVHKLSHMSRIRSLPHVLQRVLGTVRNVGEV
ncbi:hypothetical protein QT381_13485 [Galbitalea sp. SE-J8]|uniref:hypothetical protein n=1 Tax=Galbitalea sp. SE-J8 TaxID=3054952 RepID=UPI00259D29EC|nr:hypothetical protein [Galbitalea sp. SE-J8]MDM4764022.1 hypothetical protein [Galbitalea sp. SE-J8]